MRLQASLLLLVGKVDLKWTSGVFGLAKVDVLPLVELLIHWLVHLADLLHLDERTLQLVHFHDML